MPLRRAVVVLVSGLDSRERKGYHRRGFRLIPGLVKDAMSPLRLEVITPTFQGLGMCSACELVFSEAGIIEPPAESTLDEYPQEWQDEYQRLSDWVYDLSGRYGDGIRIKVLDPQSPEGLLKSLRYRVRRYPTWIVDGKTRVVGWDREALEAALSP
jgi:hypothetical protein